MAVAFKYLKSRNGGGPALKLVEMDASVTINAGDACELAANSKIQRVSAQDDSPRYVANETKTSTATGGETIQVIEVQRDQDIFEIGFTPLYNDLTASTSTTTVVTIAASGVSSNTLIGGLIFVKELNETRIITANTATSGGNIDITVTVPFSSAPTAMAIRVVPFGVGDEVIKLMASTPYMGISNAIADVTGGKVEIYAVDMLKKVAQVIFRI